MTESTAEPEATPASIVAGLMANFNEMFAPITEAAVGMRKTLEEEHGYSPTMAEMIAGEYHSAMTKGMAQVMIAKLMQGLK